MNIKNILVTVIIFLVSIGFVIAQECTSDADCPPSTIEKYCDGANACASGFYYDCINGECVEGEFVCEVCEYGCENGECIEQQCTDSDGGKDYYVKGTCKDNIGTTNTMTDFCVGNDLYETYCDNTFEGYQCVQAGTPYKCPNGCQDGACIKEMTCSSLFTMDTCLDNTNCYWDQQYDKCFNYDSTKQTCSDPDGGKDYYTQAHTFGFRTYSSSDDPSRDLRIRTGGRDACIGNTLREHYCYDTYYITSIDTTCPNGCQDGACIKGDIEQCRDEDYGCTIDNIPCCSGLKEVPLAFEENGQCIAATCGSICRPCGNGICDENENRCSCPEDCKEQECTYNSDCPSETKKYCEGANACTSTTSYKCDNGKCVAYIGGVGCTPCPYGCQNGACVSAPQGIYVKLGEKFSLVEHGEAKVTDYNYMKIRLNKISQPPCEVGFSCSPIAEVQVEMPRNWAATSTESKVSEESTQPQILIRPVQEAIVLELKEGESKEVFGAKLTLLELEKESATFVVEKSYAEGGVDVEISPSEQTISYGEKAAYKVRVTDKHPLLECPAGKECVQEILIYNIQIRNLPFLKEYPTQIKVPRGSSTSFELIVSPYEVVEAKEETQSITGKVVETTSENIVSKSLKITAVEVSEKAEVIPPSEAVESVMVIEKPVEITTTTSLIRNYKFSVTASLANNYNIQDTTYALLAIKPHTPPPEPPSFPGEKISIKLHKGWNLISLPGKLIKFESSTNEKLIGFVYLKEKQEYVTLNEAEKILGGELREYLAKNAFWIYSKTPSTLDIWVDRAISYQDLELVKGWNLVPITEDMVGGYLTDILGDCNLEKIFLWDAENQKWREINLEYSFSEYQYSYGFLVKAKDYCKLAGVEIIAPPPMPE